MVKNKNFCYGKIEEKILKQHREIKNRALEAYNTAIAKMNFQIFITKNLRGNRNSDNKTDTRTISL